MKFTRLKGVTHALASLSLTSAVVRLDLVSAVSLQKIVRTTHHRGIESIRPTHLPTGSARIRKGKFGFWIYRSGGARSD